MRSEGASPPEASTGSRAASDALPIRRFSVDLMDRTADPSSDFYAYATGGWRKSNPVPADKAIWTGFDELRDRNRTLLRAILEECATRPDAGPARRMLGDFYAAAVDTATRDRLGFAPIRADLDRIASARSVTELVRVVARFHEDGISGLFHAFVRPDRRDSRVYSLYVWQGGLSLPDRDYYLLDEFAELRGRYRRHVARLLALAGSSDEEGERDAGTVLEIETDLARASRTAAEQRDEVKNYNRFERLDLVRTNPNLGWNEYLSGRDQANVAYVVVGQPEFFAALDGLLAGRPLSDWKTYLRWHLLHSAAPTLHDAAESEDFDFFHRTLRGQLEPEPIGKRAVEAVDLLVGEALGREFVRAYFPPESRERVRALVADLREVFTDRLRSLEWMSEATRERALAKFARFRVKIGHPDRFRDYSGLHVRPDDHHGNVRRAAAFESRRRMVRVGGPVDPDEWEMTPPTVNAYFDASRNEIVFPAGILQPPFFDPEADDAVNYGAIGCVIGHEITHGYDDQGRRYDADGNLNDWWTQRDSAEFARRAGSVVERYAAVEPLPGVHINGELTLGENIADFGGVSIAFEALERRLAREPSARASVDGLTPQQRFFIAYGQVWRANYREPELRRRLAVDPHSPAPYRVALPVRQLDGFHAAFPAASTPPDGPGATLPLRIW